MRAGSLRASSRPRQRRRPSRRPTCCSAWAPDRGRRRPRPLAVGHPAGEMPMPRERATMNDRGAGSQALLVPVSLHLERLALRVRDRLHGRRRDGLLGRPGRVEHARPRRIRPHPRRSAARARRPLRAAGHQRARRGAVPRSRQLVAVDHPRDVEVFPNEGLRSPPRPPFRLYAAAAPASTRRSTITATTYCRSPRAIAAIRTTSRAADPRLRRAARADARPRVRRDRALLLLTGWTDYAFSSDNVAAHQAGLALQPPSLQVQGRDRRAGRRSSTRSAFPVGRPQTVVVDLRGTLRGPSREVRIVTNMRDLLGSDPRRHVAGRGRTPACPRARSRCGRPALARILRRGARRTGREPSATTTRACRRCRRGRRSRAATRETGDVRELLCAADDMFVDRRPGDEIALTFDAAALPPLRHGWTRTFLLYADGFSKEMDINSATPDTRRSAAVPRDDAAIPTVRTSATRSDDAHEAYRERYNTRVDHRASAVARPRASA